MLGEKPICPITFVGDPIEIELNRKYIKNQLHIIRISKHMNQKTVAAVTGLSTKTISDIENVNSGNPTLNSIIRYLDCFGYELTIQEKKV